jgi:transcriptional regulator with XRE-family HTH domain
MPGSIVRASLQLAARYLRQARQPDSNHIFLVEHQGGVCCCRLHFGATNRITLLPTQLPFASVEVELGSEARILGLVDLELRPLLKTRKRGDPICGFPDVAPELARHWTPGTLKRTIFEAPAHLLRNARMRAGLSFRTASTMSREIARTLGDERHFTSQGSLSDYEANDRPPRHLHKLFSLCILYAIPFSALLNSYAINATIGSNRVPAEWMLEQEEPESTNSLIAPIRGFLDENLKRIRELPFFVYRSLSLLSGLPDLSLHDVFWVDGQTQPMHPVLYGALLAVVFWIRFSYTLGYYFRSFAHFNKTYGAMGAVIALMVWLYWTSFFMLVGAELNCQLAKETSKGKIKQDEKPSGLTGLDLAA